MKKYTHILTFLTDEKYTQKYFESNIKNITSNQYNYIVDKFECRNFVLINTTLILNRE